MVLAQARRFGLMCPTIFRLSDALVLRQVRLNCERIIVHLPLRCWGLNSMNITHRYMQPLTLALLLSSLACAQTPQPTSATTPVLQKKAAHIDPNKFALIINGAGGEPAYATQFDQWSAELSSVLTERFGFDTTQVKRLAEKPGLPTTGRATAEEVKQTFVLLKTQLQPENVLFVFLIGHGSFDGKESKFNLVGPDLSASEYNSLLASLPTRRIVVCNMASASGEFARALSAKGRIIITATRNGQETNATRFAGFFIAALTANDADTDQDGHISVLEAFAYATRLTAAFYTRAGRLATEHALLDDNGDGIGHERIEGGDGILARATYLDSLTLAEATENVATAKLLRERTRLEGEIEQLIARKGSIPETEYEATLEKLFVELAKVNRSIKQAGS
jgi:hypothetical protein